MSYDSTAATELALFIENDGDLYRQQTQPIFKNLITKMARGIYDHDKAVKLMGYLMESGAKKYAREFGGTWNHIFSVATRKHVAEQFTRAFEDEARLGNYDNFLPKKYQKTRTNPTRLRRARAAIRGMGRVRRKRMIHTALGTMMNPRSAGTRISKKEWYARGAWSNSKLYRKARKNGTWQYFTL